jgi:hypothetical protein
MQTGNQPETQHLPGYSISSHTIQAIDSLRVEENERSAKAIWNLYAAKPVWI